MNHFSKRIAGLALALTMVLSLLPVSALASAEVPLPEVPLGEEAVSAALSAEADERPVYIPDADSVGDSADLLDLVTVYQKHSGTPQDGVYAIYTNESTDSNNRILYHTGTEMTDKLGGSITNDRLTLNGGFATNRQLWRLTAVTDGYTLQCLDSNYYLDLTAATSGNINTSATAVTLTITETSQGVYTISKSGGKFISFDATNNGNYFASDTAAELRLFKQTEVDLALDIPAPPTDATVVTDWKTMVPAPGTTQDQPFPSGTGGSTNFRIPAIITLKHQADATKNGRIVAAIDARYTHTSDACGLDTILSYSDDNGANWSYLYPNYFGDSTDSFQSYATAFIDPVMVEGTDGAIYLMVDLYPGGVAINTAPTAPDAATGYVTIEGKQRLALYLTTSGQNDSNYEYYIGDFTNGYAPIFRAGGTDDSDGLYVDEHFYLYQKTGADKVPENDRIYCQRIGNNAQWIQQNVFFYNASLHVRNASYLWIIKSTDGGATWSAPIMVNDQVRTGNDIFYGVGPGAGLCIESGSLTGMILLPVYTYSNQIASFIWTDDQGATWHRSEDATSSAWSSESCLVQLDNTTVRHFYRDGGNVVKYTDHTWNGSGWEAGSSVATTAPKRGGNGCQLSAIIYSQKEDGKSLILLSTPANPAGRQNGKIHVFLVNNDAGHTMELITSYTVTAQNENYAYSSITETKDGDIAIFYEDTGTHVPFLTVPFNTVRYGEELGACIRAAEALNSQAFTEESWAAVEAALIPARAAMESGVKADIESATTAMQQAIDGLVTLQVSLSGTVTNGTAPVAGAVVTLEDENYRPAHGMVFTTGADGTFHFETRDDLPPLCFGTYYLKVQAPGYLVSTTRATPFPDREHLSSETTVTMVAESTDGNIYANNFDENDISMMGCLSPDGTAGVPTFEHVEYNGSGAVKITMNSEDRDVNNAVVKVDAAKIKNGTVSFDLTGLTNTIRLGMTLRGLEPTKRIFVGQEDSESKWFWEYWNGSANDYSSVATKEIGLYPNETRRVRVELNEKKVQVFIDGVQIYDATMSDNLPLDAGYVGINLRYHSGTQYILDNFRVVSRDEAPENSHTISGTVMDGANPVASAQVALRKAADNALITGITTNANGEFRLSPTTETNVKLSVSATGYLTVPDETITLSDDITGKVISLTADKSALTELYDAHKNDTQGDWSDESWAAFRTALTAAGTVKDKAGATKAEIDRAIADLNAAIAALARPVDKTALNAAVEEAEAAKTGIEKLDKTAAEVDKGTKFVTQAEMTALETAIAAAKAVADKADATQAEVNKAVTDLNAAKDTFTQAIKTGTKETASAPVTPPSSSSGSSSRPAPSTEVKEDGTKVTTETKPDGTKVETTETPDGAKEVVETKKDGTVTATTETPDGTKAVVETKPDGSKNQTVEQADGTKSELAVTKEGDVTITVTDATGEELVKTEIPAAIPEAETKFEDVVEAAPWAEEAINKVAGLELVKGTGGNNYSPVAPMTRGSLATVLHRLSNGKTDYNSTFKDVAQGKYYSDGVAWAAKAGVVTGVSSTEFAPEKTITREQLAVMLCRYAKLVGMSTKTDGKALEQFVDGDKTGSWAADSLAWCVDQGILKGKSGNALDPNADVTRAEVAVMLDRFISLLK